MKQAMIDYMQKPKYDELYTPEYAVEPLLKYLPKNITIWECTDYGSSSIASVLRGGGYKVISTKKEDFDFLEDKADFDFDVIITNPPYSLKDKFIEKCYEYKKPFALLLPITSLEGVKRGEMFKENGVELIVLDKRVDFLEKKGNWFNTSWFCWKLLNKELNFEKLDKEDKK